MNFFNVYNSIKANHPYNVNWTLWLDPQPHGFLVVPTGSLWPSTTPCLLKFTTGSGIKWKPIRKENKVEKRSHPNHFFFIPKFKSSACKYNQLNHLHPNHPQRDHDQLTVIVGHENQWLWTMCRKSRPIEVYPTWEIWKRAESDVCVERREGRQW